jgi:predicted ATPase
VLSRIYSQNFKCFRELALPVGALTLLTGFNAAGKSTAIQPLLLIGQHLRTNTRAFKFSLLGSLARLGTPGEILNESAGHDRWLALGISENASEVRWVLRAEDRSATSTVQIDRIEFLSGGQVINTVQPNHSMDLDIPAPFKTLLSRARDVIYISAARAGSDEAFPSPDDAEPINADVGVEGQFAPWWFDQFADEPIDASRLHPREPAPTLRRQLNAWASELFPGAEANAVRLPRTSLIRLELRTQITDDWRRPSNIGYGLTYAFPILVALLLARDGQIVAIDSPEAHLHPRGQSAMGRILAKFGAAGVQILAETHSDHVLNGVRLAVKEGVVPRSEAVIHFFDRFSPNAQVRIVSPVFDSNGSLSEWPPGFFDQTEQDLAGLAGWDLQ